MEEFLKGADFKKWGSEGGPDYGLPLNFVREKYNILLFLTKNEFDENYFL